MKSPDSQTSTHKRRWLPQIGLKTLLLLTACAAVWIGVWVGQRSASSLQNSLVSTRLLARELVIEDRDQLAIIRQDERFYDENIWSVYVPREGLKLHMATIGIDPNKNIDLPAEVSADLHPGTHQIEVIAYKDDTEWFIYVQVDMEVVLQVLRPIDWNPNVGSTGGGAFDMQGNIKPGEKAVLFNRRFNIPGPPGPAQPHPDGNGIMLWIQ